MHILQGLLALLLLPGVCGAADKRFKLFYGVWTGTVKVEPSGCVWDVKAQFSPRGSSVSGSFTYSGSCAKGIKNGYFNADSLPESDGDDCLNAAIALPGPLEVHGAACMEGPGELLFEAGNISGRLSLEKGGGGMDLLLELPKGSAYGSFTKVLPDKKASKKTSKALSRAASPKVNKDEKKEKPLTPELFIGRN